MIIYSNKIKTNVPIESIAMQLPTIDRFRFVRFSGIISSLIISTRKTVCHLKLNCVREQLVYQPVLLVCSLFSSCYLCLQLKSIEITAILLALEHKILMRVKQWKIYPLRLLSSNKQVDYYLACACIRLREGCG